MRYLTERKWSPKTASGPRPHKSYKIGQQCCLNKCSNFYKLAEDYYQTYDIIILSEHVHENCSHDYIVEPLFSDDKLKVSHWDLWPHGVFVETRVFIPVHLAQSGTMVKILDNLNIEMIKGNTSKGILLANGVTIDKNQLVEVMADPNEKHLAESFVRYK